MAYLLLEPLVTTDNFVAAKSAGELPPKLIEQWLEILEYYARKDKT